ncbi:hypothetical protein NE237_025000 [Protea cynaroides]|uniref:Uncharacterized protein n=1 Tax=Protea cynaroides TaxID=273540 RepID=A0A9Q0JZ32_9MAGN|nr:hypothetical protein NE237_025000 [Protea cynaroides]
MIFNDVYHFRVVLQDFIIQARVDILLLRMRMQGLLHPRIHASPIEDGVTYMIAQGTRPRMTNNTNATSNWIAKRLATVFEVKPEMKIESMRTVIQEKFSIDAHDQKPYRARRIAKKMNEGSHAKSYALLPQYGH